MAGMADEKVRVPHTRTDHISYKATRELAYTTTTTTATVAVRGTSMKLSIEPDDTTYVHAVFSYMMENQLHSVSFHWTLGEESTEYTVADDSGASTYGQDYIECGVYQEDLSDEPTAVPHMIWDIPDHSAKSLGTGSDLTWTITTNGEATIHIYVYDVCAAVTTSSPSRSPSSPPSNGPSMSPSSTPSTSSTDAAAEELVRFDGKTKPEVTVGTDDNSIHWTTTPGE
jgi:hypothetical protein